MKITHNETKFLRTLAAGRDQFVNVEDILLNEMVMAGYLRRVGPNLLDVVLTGAGRKIAQDI